MKSDEVHNFYKYLGTFISNKRRAWSLTQTQLGKKTGITRGSITAIELGIIRIDYLRLRKIAAALKFNLEEIK